MFTSTSSRTSSTVSRVRRGAAGALLVGAAAVALAGPASASTAHHGTTAQHGTTGHHGTTAHLAHHRTTSAVTVQMGDAVSYRR